ncbi:MAG: hypothetical protein A3K19_13935 [Lentisphaerae bacterium RIFOXYB12_FULL_65_16]|nr:MAG: hypothetical protein A3K18_25935 [Lentisphaerae bacterium RIFOXYA12_64_32]OGV88215.1 MAG: hypothetical protein A3K19_13935 [Lentisphaerae bacterium RIFOXYB12_FULL_65_16]
MANYAAYIVTEIWGFEMITANIAELKDRLSHFLDLVAEKGEEVEIRRRNLPLARIVPITPNRRNRTVLGCDLGSAAAVDDLTEPVLPPIASEGL